MSTHLHFFYAPTAKFFTTPPWSVFSNKDSAWTKIVCCVSKSPGLPKGRPIKKGVSRVRGTAILRNRFSKAFTAITTVATPASSANRATCPTDTWQTGQTGTRRSASRPPCTISSTQAGPSCFIMRLWEQAPIKDQVAG